MLWTIFVILILAIILRFVYVMFKKKVNALVHTQVVELRTLVNEFNRNLQTLIDAKINDTSITVCKERFVALQASVDNILTEKILLITQIGDKTREEVDLELTLLSEDEEENSSEDESFDQNKEHKKYRNGYR